MTAHPVAVTGLGVASAIGTGVQPFADALRSGAVGVRTRDEAPDLTPVWAPLPELDLDGTCAGLDDEFAARVRNVVLQAPPAAAAAVLCAVEAAVDARLRELDPYRVAVVVAGCNLTNRQEHDAVLRQEAGRRVLPRHAVQLFDSDVAASVTEALGTYGEASTAGAASASGGLAIAQARRAVLSGDVDAVVVVGVPMLLTDADLSALGSLGALCRHAGYPAARSCRPFDRGAAGFVYGEGAAALVLESAQRAVGRGAPTRAMLRGAASRSSASRSPSPDADAEAAVMADALRSADLGRHDVGVVNAHATASAPGDAAEAAAIRDVFGDDIPYVNASKALIGHCLASAGVLEAVGVLAQLEGGWLHPNPNLTDPIDDLPWVGRSAQTWDGWCAVSNSFGFGGLHTSLVLTAE